VIVQTTNIFLNGFMIPRNISKNIEILLALVSIHSTMSMKYECKIKVFEDVKIWFIVSNLNK
jgi:hypothetical protein